MSNHPAFTDDNQVYLNGELVSSVIGADVEEGYVDLLVKRVGPEGWIQERIRRRGDVRIVVAGREVLAVHVTA
jgi:hypothetical protein